MARDASQNVVTVVAPEVEIPTFARPKVEGLKERPNRLSEATDWRPSPDGGTYWTLWRVDGEPIAPEDLVARIERGEVRIGSHRDAFLRAVNAFADHVGMFAEDRARYERPIGADADYERRVKVERLQSAWEDGGDFATERFLTGEQVCELLQISESTLTRESGYSLPAPIRIGRQRRWRLTALLRMLDHAA
jgi:predicted DNA-binding transcriptional regulator AlpA